MDVAFTYYLYGITGILLVLSFINSKKKTSLVLKKTWRLFFAVLPQFISILLIIGILLAAVQKETIQLIIGSESGVKGILLSALLGSATIMPVLIAFPIASELMKSGAGLMQIAVFISTLTTVGLITIPLEIKYLGRKITLIHNLIALIFSFITASIIGVMLQ